LWSKRGSLDAHSWEENVKGQMREEKDGGGQNQTWVGIKEKSTDIRKRSARVGYIGEKRLGSGKGENHPKKTIQTGEIKTSHPGLLPLKINGWKRRKKVVGGETSRQKQREQRFEGKETQNLSEKIHLTATRKQRGRGKGSKTKPSQRQNYTKNENQDKKPPRDGSK